MKRRKIALIVVIIVFLILFIIPLNISVTKEGGTMYFSPIVPAYTVVDLNRFGGEGELAPHDDTDNAPSGLYTLKGTEIYIFGHKVYENTYTVDGLQHRR